MFNQASHTFSKPIFRGGSGYRFAFNGKENIDEITSPGDWHTTGFQNVADALMKYTNNKVEDYTFDWSGKGNGFFQTKINRRKAAELLVKHVLAHKFDGEEISLVGVSHGGNVSIRAARILGKMGFKVNVFTLNTPASKNVDSEQIKDSDLGKLNPVDPECTPPAQLENK